MKAKQKTVNISKTNDAKKDRSPAEQAIAVLTVWQEEMPEPNPFKIYVGEKAQRDAADKAKRVAAYEEMLKTAPEELFREFLRKWLVASELFDALIASNNPILLCQLQELVRDKQMQILRQQDKNPDFTSADMIAWSLDLILQRVIAMLSASESSLQIAYRERYTMPWFETPWGTYPGFSEVAQKSELGAGMATNSRSQIASLPTIETADAIAIIQGHRRQNPLLQDGESMVPEYSALPKLTKETVNQWWPYVKGIIEERYNLELFSHPFMKTLSPRCRKPDKIENAWRKQCRQALKGLAPVG